MARGLQGICDGINHLYRVNDSDGKQISKTFAEITVLLTVSGRTSQTSYDTGNV